jgi:hypothetical protein
MGLRGWSIAAFYYSSKVHNKNFLYLTIIKIVVWFVLMKIHIRTSDLFVTRQYELNLFFDWITSEEIQRSYGILNQTMVIGAKLVFYVGVCNLAYPEMVWIITGNILRQRIDTSSLFDLPILITLLECNSDKTRADELRKLYGTEDFNNAIKANCLFINVGRVGFTQRPTRSFII